MTSTQKAKGDRFEAVVAAVVADCGFEPVALGLLGAGHRVASAWAASTRSR